MDPNLKRMQTLQSLGIKLFCALRPRWPEIANKVKRCVSYIDLYGPYYTWKGQSCNYRFCPKCSWVRMIRYSKAIESLPDNIKQDLYFITYTWKEGFEPTNLTADLNLRTHLVKSFSSKDIIWKWEFTERRERVAHAHVHSIQYGAKLAHLFNVRGNRNVDVRPFDGDMREIIKYLAAPESFDMIPLLEGSFHIRPTRLRGMRGFKRFNELPVPILYEDIDKDLNFSYYTICTYPEHFQELTQNQQKRIKETCDAENAVISNHFAHTEVVGPDHPAVQAGALTSLSHP